MNLVKRQNGLKCYVALKCFVLRDRYKIVKALNQTYFNRLTTIKQGNWLILLGRPFLLDRFSVTLVDYDAKVLWSYISRFDGIVCLDLIVNINFWKTLLFCTKNLETYNCRFIKKNPNHLIVGYICYIQSPEKCNACCFL